MRVEILALVVFGFLLSNTSCISSKSYSNTFCQNSRSLIDTVFGHEPIKLSMQKKGGMFIVWSDENKREINAIVVDTIVLYTMTEFLEGKNMHSIDDYRGFPVIFLSDVGIDCSRQLDGRIEGVFQRSYLKHKKFKGSKNYGANFSPVVYMYDQKKKEFGWRYF